jgi:hypothetical protein
MDDILELTNSRRSLNCRLALALEFAIGALNDVPRFRTHFSGPNGRQLSSYEILPRLETVLKDAEAARPRRRGRNGPGAHPNPA